MRGESFICIVTAFRSLRDGLAKAGIGRNIDRYLEKCKEYGIDTADLYYTEDQPGDAWYLIGDWKPVRSGQRQRAKQWERDGI